MKRLDKNKQYIEISSEGEIEEDAFLIMGGSTKHGNEDKIGRFGSGLKYSVATLLSKGNDFEIWSGNEIIEFSLKRRDFRGEMFDMISINGNETNYSTQMGPDWSYYDALRDIYANAVDENLLTFQTVDRPDPEEGKTKFYIQITEEVQEFIDNIEKYFSIFRKDEILEHNGNKIFESAGHLIVYKSGFKVYEDKEKKSLFNYDLPNIEINESRELKYYYDMVSRVRRLVLEYPNQEVADKLIKHSEEIDDDGKSEMWEFAIDWDSSWITASEDWEKYFDGKTLLPAEASSFYSGQALSGSSESFSRFPSSFVGTVSRKRDIKVVGKESDACPYLYKDASMNSEDFMIILGLRSILINMDFDMEDIDIKKVSFHKQYATKSSVDKTYGKKIILLSESIFDDEDEVKSEFIRQIPALYNDVRINSTDHFQAFSRMVVDKFLTKRGKVTEHKF